MAKYRKRRKNHGKKRLGMAIIAVALVFLIGIFAAWFFESHTAVQVQNAGKQLTSHTNETASAQIYMNGQWYQKKNVETLLVMGIDDSESIASSGSYNNANQADFLALFIRDLDTGDCAAIHLNRDTMTNITVLGVTGEAVGTQYAQLALAYNYGRGENDSSRNTADAVSNLLFGMDVDHYITLTMSAVPIMNDWAGGITLEILDDMTQVDAALVAGSEVTLYGDQALYYVRTRMGLDDSTNLHRMERQRQYASAWVSAAKSRLGDSDAVADLLLDLSPYHCSDCTAEELSEFAGWLGENPSVEIYELPGESVCGEEFMEYFADDAEIQRIVLELFYETI